MTAFIRQEAMEKANEIRLKADEEFAIEKSKLVRQETASIDTSYEKKFKQASMSQQITRSTVSNKSRLRILSARQELLNKLFEDANKKLGDVAKDKKKYQDVMKNLILEGRIRAQRGQAAGQGQEGRQRPHKEGHRGGTEGIQEQDQQGRCHHH
jgi:V-type H+-transporting ATPase subunit E